MTKKTHKVIYWVVTGLLSAMVLMSVGMYLFNHDMVTGVFASLGYPTYLVYPLAAAKFLGIVAILSRKNKLLTEWAYAGFFYTFVLGFFAHYMVGDGQFGGALIALALLIGSYVCGKKIYS